MTEEQKLLWQKIEDFEIDDNSSSFTFSNRLARENNWSLQYALRVILEYKKFIFLICISEVPQTPSDQIDQAWHLHLLYTKSYWIDFCKGLLNKEIHHGPTKGAEEKPRFKDQYQQTLDLYEEVFKESAPKDIWVDPDTRFKEIRFIRVNTHQNWVLPKPGIFRK